MSLQIVIKNYTWLRAVMVACAICLFRWYLATKRIGLNIFSYKFEDLLAACLAGLSVQVPTPFNNIRIISTWTSLILVAFVLPLSMQIFYIYAQRRNNCDHFVLTVNNSVPLTLWHPQKIHIPPFEKYIHLIGKDSNR